jgi:tyrosine-protein phosphatase YwqE
VYELQLQNYVPLLAHPERYLFLGERAYVRLKERGCRYQLNLMSLAGQYGVRAREVAWFLLENGLYDFAGTDMHHLGVFRHAMERLRLTAPEVDRLRN